MHILTTICSEVEIIERISIMRYKLAVLTLELQEEEEESKSIA
jgi:hypothetical protein